MPKKTRRQKILAQQRRHIQLTSAPVVPPTHVPETNIPAATFHFQQPHVPVKAIENTNDQEELTVIKKDITKTLILAAIAVAIELVVHSMLHGT